MTIYRRVPSLDDNGQFPDRYAPPSVAVDAAAAVAAKVAAEAARDAAQALTDVTVTTGAVVGDDLVLTRTDTTTVNVGNVRGPQGVPGPTGATGPTGAAGGAQIAGDLGGTAAAPTVTGGTHHDHTAEQVSDSTAAGRSLLTAADAPTQRTALGLGTAATAAATAFEQRLAGMDPKAHVDFTTKADGAAPLVDDAGNAAVLRFTALQAAPIISGGKLIAQPLTNADGYASYYQIPLGANGNRIGCTYTVPSDVNYDTTTCLALWGSPLWEHGYGGPVPQSRCHFVLTPGSGAWNFGLFDGTGTVHVVASGTFAPLAYDDTEIWRHEVYVDEVTGSAYLSLPDGQIAVVTAAQIATAIAGFSGWTAGNTLKGLAGQTAVLEHFAAAQGLARAGTYPKFLTFWADTSTVPGSRRTLIPASQAQVLKQAAAAATAANQPTASDGCVEWAPSATTIAVPAYPGNAIDATNAAITVTAPANGRLVIEASGWVELAGAGDVYWELHDSTPTVWPARHALVTTNSEVQTARVHLVWRINVTPNAAKTFYLWHYCATGTALLRLSPAYPLFLTARPFTP